MHKLTKTIVTVSLMAPMAAHSLGIGNIKLYSALNQKLHAEISLSLSAGEHIDDIQVNLATPSQFDKLGISWNYFISKVKFKPITKSNGQVVIKMTSDQPLQEPILDFLVEVSWPNGELYKEFTVLVDPPVVYRPQVTTTPIATAVKPKKKLRRSSTAVPVRQNKFNSLAVKGEYGPTTRADTLWKVAEKANTHGDVSVEQMMMALYKANPGAFYKKNVNALMQGKSLRIPEKTEIVKVSKKQAKAQFSRQMAIWEGKTVDEPLMVTEATDEPRNEVQDSNSKLTLVPPSDEAITPSAALTANATEAQSLVTENQQLQERLANLEKQFAIMQEMMAIKDQQLAALQDTHAGETKTLPVLSQDNVPVTAELTDQTKPQLVPDEPGSAIAPVAQAKQETQQQQAKVLPVIKEERTAVDEKTNEKKSGLSYYYLGVGALGLLGFAWLFGRKRKTEKEIDDISMFATMNEPASTDTQEKITVPVLDNNATYDVGAVGESSFLSEFTPADFDVFETDTAEVDPSSEADVYLAYGRYQQAEELMRHAIEESPEKDDYKLKLLDVFYASKNVVDFESYAHELVKSGKQKDINFWSKVSAMGREIIPKSALFSAAQTEATFEATDVPADEYLNASTSTSPDDVQSITDAMSKPGSDVFKSAGIDRPVNSKNSPDIESVDFDLSQFEAIEADKRGAKAIQSLETFDFNSDDIDASLAKIKEPKAGSLADNNDFDFNFDFDEVSAAAGVASNSVKKETEVSDLTDKDKSETKIDLAKAYIDMGDLDAARTIAQEVVEHGDDAQKLEAQAILNLLS